MYYVYALKSKIRNYIYVGLTDNPVRRIHQHNSGYEKTTKPYLPYALILLENYPTRLEARSREKYLKGGSGKKYLKSIKGELPEFIGD